MYEPKPPFVTHPIVKNPAAADSAPASPSDRTTGSPLQPLSRRLLSDLVHFVFPKTCLACGEPIPCKPPTLGKRPRPGDLGLCNVCRGGLVADTERGCLQCGALLGDETGHRRRMASRPTPRSAQCADCRVPSPTIHQCLSVWSYQPPIDAVMQGLKFRHLPYLSRHLGGAVTHHLKDHLDDLEDLDAVVPVPLHWRRRLQRGFDQTHLLAQSVARNLSLPLRPVLHRRRATSAQSRLSRAARQRNLQQAFSPRLGACSKVRDRHLLLVDDVVTTGATLMAAGTALQALCPYRITAITVARTPSQGRSPSG